ncbi:MAG: hypothetical protein ACOCZU_03175 [Planctomycetota bacterium]
MFKRSDGRETKDVPTPVDTVDGIPDRAISPPRWRFVLLGVIFICWIAFLIYVAAAGGSS